jgi:hypothetical protein
MMSPDEQIEILESIIKDPKSYPSARVSAIRLLREIQAEEPNTPSAFDDLDELAPRRKYRPRGG